VAIAPDVVMQHSGWLHNQSVIFNHWMTQYQKTHQRASTCNHGTAVLSPWFILYHKWAAFAVMT
jgi:hypothetical protein